MQGRNIVPFGLKKRLHVLTVQLENHPHDL